MDELVIENGLKGQIEREGASAYPNECCGIMIGRDEGGVRRVEKLVAMANVFDEKEQHHRFSIDPAALMAAEKSAAAEGRLVVGFYHSHPDHPARPSEFDRVHAWPFYSYVIVSIMQRRAEDMTSWVLDDSTEQFSEQRVG